MDNDERIRILERNIERIRASSNGDTKPVRVNPPIDLVALRDMEFTYDWLVEGFWPMGAHMHIFAAPKTGKSLVTLWVACCIAKGVDPFNGQPVERRRVSYID